jgi:hypothetical protein
MVAAAAVLPDKDPEIDHVITWGWGSVRKNKILKIREIESA